LIYDINNRLNQEPTEASTPEKPASGTGIVGDSTNHYVAMTRLWITDDKIIEKVDIQVAGAEFDCEHADRLSKKFIDRPIEEMNFILDYKQDRSHQYEHIIPDIVYESIIRAIDSYFNPRKFTEIQEPSIIEQPDEILEIQPVPTGEILSDSAESQDTMDKPKQDPYSGEF
jgi:hypothetical protein